LFENYQIEQKNQVKVQIKQKWFYKTGYYKKLNLMGEK